MKLSLSPCTLLVNESSCSIQLNQLVKYGSRHTCVVLRTYVCACVNLLSICTYVGIYVRTHMYVRVVHDLQVDSPVSLLSQDMSREYLHQQDARKKYEVKCLCDGLDECID